MDHDAPFSDTPGPKSHRIADVRAACEGFVKDSVAVMREKIEGEAVYGSNESGHLAWDVSLLVRAACLMWRVTHDVSYLHMATGWAVHVVARTDEARSQPDWRGREGPSWSAGARYTAGTAIVGTLHGAPIRLQAAADRIVVERPSARTAVVHTIREGRRVWSSPPASLLPEDANYLPDVLASRSAIFSVQLRGLPGPVDLTFLEPGEHELITQRAAHLVHTGMIARSLVAVADALESSGSIDTISAVSPDELYTAAGRALFVHDRDLRMRTGQPWYVTPPDFPSRRLGLELPHNQVVDCATTLMLLGYRLGDRGLESLGKGLANRFLAEIEDFSSGRIVHPWHYYPPDSDIFLGIAREAPIEERHVAAVQRAEDSSHATLRVRALLEWRAIDPSLVSDSSLRAVALSFRRHYMTSKNGIATLRWLANSERNAPRQGRSDTYPGAWAGLTAWDPTLKRRINSLAYRHPPTQIFGATVLSSVEILAMNAGVPIYAPLDRSDRE